MDNFLLLPRALAAFAFDLAFAIAVGVLVAHVCMQANAPLTILRRALTVAAATMLLALPAQLWLTAASMLASASPGDVFPQLSSVLTSTHAGRVLIPASALVILLLLVTRIARWPAAATALLIALDAVRAASGHAASDGDFTLREAMQFLHLASIAIWSGSILVAGFLVVPRLSESVAISTFAKRLSAAATIAIQVVALTGIYNAWLGLGAAPSVSKSLAPLAHTQWGLLLTTKSALVLIALALGANNRRLLAVSNILKPNNAAQLRLSLRCEAFAMLAILLLSAFLANSPPATS